MVKVIWDAFEYMQQILQGSYRQVCINSRTFQGLLKDIPPVFKDYIMKNIEIIH